MKILKKLLKKDNASLENKAEKPSVFINDEYSISKVNGNIEQKDCTSLTRLGLEMRLEQMKHSVNNVAELLPSDREKYKLNEDEVILLEEFYKQFKPLKKKSNLYVGRTSDGALDMQYKGCPFGRARIQGKKHWFQYYIGQNGKNKVIYGEIDEFIPYVEKWVKYIKNYL
ncbi:hypothetical protein [Pseudobutyrivibrio ruminis]|uniref:hypothetical protein n=1 Tax=Pseudobutyrivibrio ruminis TaxID=46206 RepID=UPI000C123994|nr:hypothetical protein [Pseudobutyrivibrio ruminis]